LGMSVLLPEEEFKEYQSLPSIQYWSVYGKQAYPLLCPLVLRLNAIPTSNASSERVWSTFSFIHNNPLRPRGVGTPGSEMALPSFRKSLGKKCYDFFIKGLLLSFQVEKPPVAPTNGPRVEFSSTGPATVSLRMSKSGTFFRS